MAATAQTQFVAQAIPRRDMSRTATVRRNDAYAATPDQCCSQAAAPNRGIEPYPTACRMQADWSVSGSATATPTS
jgi:hypothetical protein